MEESIIVDNISKRFAIGSLRKETQLREALTNFFKNSIFKHGEKVEDIWALKNVSFKIKSGELIGIIGKNGAGKSTLLKILSKITQPTEGKIKIKGRVGSLLEVGTGFHDELTGRENIYLNGSILGMKHKEVKKKLENIIYFSEVGKFLDTPIKRYSSGMKLKLGFSVAAHLDTDILFIDEVLAVGDIAFQRKCFDKVNELRNSGKTIIFVSHVMMTVENLCQRALWIDEGKLRLDGLAGDVIKQYIMSVRTKWSEDFKISEVPMSNIANGFDLNSIKNRGASGEIIFTRILFLDKNGESKKVIYCGDSLKVRLHYKVRASLEIPEFYFRIRNEYGDKIATFSPTISGHIIPKLDYGNGYFDFEINYLNIMPDRYYISVYILKSSNNDKNDKIIIDSVEHAATLDVEMPPAYLADREINKFWGVVFLPCQWNFEGLNI